MNKFYENLLEHEWIGINHEEFIFKMSIKYIDYCASLLD